MRQQQTEPKLHRVPDASVRPVGGLGGRLPPTISGSGAGKQPPPTSPADVAKKSDAGPRPSTCDSPHHAVSPDIFLTRVPSPQLPFLDTLAPNLGPAASPVHPAAPLDQPSTLSHASSSRCLSLVSASRHPSCSADQLRLALYTQRSRSAPLRLTSDGASPLTRRRNAVLMLVGPCCTDVKDACTDGVDVALSRELLGHERQI